MSLAAALKGAQDDGALAVVVYNTTSIRGARKARDAKVRRMVLASSKRRAAELKQPQRWDPKKLEAELRKLTPQKLRQRAQQEGHVDAAQLRQLYGEEEEERPVHSQTKLRLGLRGARS